MPSAIGNSAQSRELLERKDRDLALREAKIEKITFELARLKRWKFGAKREAMSAEQRRLFEETLAEDEASLRAQLERCAVKRRPLTARTPSPRRRHAGRAARRCPSICVASSIATSPRARTAASLAAASR